MTSKAWQALDSADEIIERMATEMAADARAEIQFMETLGVKAEMGAHLAVAALNRAAMKVQAGIDRKAG